MPVQAQESSCLGIGSGWDVGNTVSPEESEACATTDIAASRGHLACLERACGNGDLLHGSQRRSLGGSAMGKRPGLP
ncbi:hypothetical protein WJX72_000499 [[Myrmecia] bisecta]|uniref:Arginine vasotocin receptor n=1 Tax=[Myrmecia] bisecta TaxID=41462 RepID=A0AAW1P8K5_9CHLO